MKSNGKQTEGFMKHEDFIPHIKGVKKTDQWVGVVKPDQVLKVAKALRDLGFEHLLDLCVVDYLHYGMSEWNTQGSREGFSRAQAEIPSDFKGPRFVVVCHLLAMASKERFRLKIELDETLTMPSLTKIWPSSNWYEREAYDLFGVVFKHHPDFRRILTDYGFVGYPMRKDFPMIGTVEMRYDGERGACVYEPVSIEDRVGVPKVIRQDNRYVEHE